MQHKKNLLTIFIFLFFSVIIYFLIIKQIIYPTIIPMVKGGVINLFADWSVIINANICQAKGYDVFLNNPCDQWSRMHVYGDILLHIPYIDRFPNFYFIYLPLTLNLVFLYSIINFFTFQDKTEYLCLFFIVLSAPVILAIERANIDIIIFLFVIFISKNKNILVNYLILILTTISKFYPICMAIIFLFKKKIKKIIINLIIFLLITCIILFFQSESLIKIFNNKDQFSGSGIYNFSFKGGLDFLLNLKVFINNKNYFIKYLYLILVLIIPLYVTILLNFKKIINNNSIVKLLFENNFENRIYILSSTLILFCYFSFSNFFYREIFFLGLIPWLLKNRYLIENKFINLFFYILVSKFFISTLFIFLVTNNIFKNLNIFIILTKYCLDFYLIAIVFVVLLGSLKGFYKNI
tara:strand:+ start:668 stop:1894 length:1227 start_codon:yes stop_codon:yes gene_type:complete